MNRPRVRSAHELADALRHRIPGAVRRVEQQCGMRLHDVLHRRNLPECQRAIRALVLELHGAEWAPVEIARWLDTDPRAVERAIRQTEGTEGTP